MMKQAYDGLCAVGKDVCTSGQGGGLLCSGVRRSSFKGAGRGVIRQGRMEGMLWIRV